MLLGCQFGSSLSSHCFIANSHYRNVTLDVSLGLLYLLNITAVSYYRNDVNLGVGLGLLYLPNIVAVSYYFQEKRAIATGVAVCGAGVGCFIFAPLGLLLLDKYDWKNAMLFVAGVTLNGCVFGALLRPLQPVRRCRKPRAKNILDRFKEKVIPKDLKETCENGSVKEKDIIKVCFLSCLFDCLFVSLGDILWLHCINFVILLINVGDIICMYVCLSLCRSRCLYAYVLVSDIPCKKCVCVLSMSVCLSVCLFVRPSVRPPARLLARSLVRPPARPSVRPSVRLSVHMFLIKWHLVFVGIAVCTHVTHFVIFWVSVFVCISFKMADALFLDLLDLLGYFMDYWLSNTRFELIFNCIIRLYSAV